MNVIAFNKIESCEKDVTSDKCSEDYLSLAKYNSTTNAGKNYDEYYANSHYILEIIDKRRKLIKLKLKCEYFKHIKKYICHDPSPNSLSIQITKHMSKKKVKSVVNLERCLSCDLWSWSIEGEKK
jgi:hypothetical protein